MIDMLHKLRSFLDFDNIRYFKCSAFMLLPVVLIVPSIYCALLSIAIGLVLSAISYLWHYLVKRICGDINTLPMCLVLVGGFSVGLTIVLNKYLIGCGKIIFCASIISVCVFLSGYRDGVFNKARFLSALKKNALLLSVIILFGILRELLSNGTIANGIIGDGIRVTNGNALSYINTFAGAVFIVTVLVYIFELIFKTKAIYLDFDKKGMVRTIFVVSLMTVIVTLFSRITYSYVLTILKLTYLDKFCIFFYTALVVFLLQKLISRYYANMIGSLTLSFSLYISYISISSVWFDVLVSVLYMLFIASVLNAIYLKTSSKCKMSVCLVYTSVLTLIIKLIAEMLI